MVGRKVVWGGIEERGVALLGAWEGRARSATAKPPKGEREGGGGGVG